MYYKAPEGDLSRTRLDERRADERRAEQARRMHRHDGRVCTRTGGSAGREMRVEIGSTGLDGLRRSGAHALEVRSSPDSRRADARRFCLSAAWRVVARGQRTTLASNSGGASSAPPARTSGSVEESTGARARKLESCIGGDGHTTLTTSWRQSPVTNQVWLGSRAFTESSTRRSLTRGPSARRTCTGCA